MLAQRYSNGRFVQLCSTDFYRTMMTVTNERCTTTDSALASPQGVTVWLSLRRNSLLLTIVAVLESGMHTLLALCSGGKRWTRWRRFVYRDVEGSSSCCACYLQKMCKCAILNSVRGDGAAWVIVAAASSVRPANLCGGKYARSLSSAHRSTYSTA